MYIIAGLGNPTKQYEGTRHNVGFDVIDRIADEYNISVETRKGKALTGTGIIAGRKVLLAKPQTYISLDVGQLRIRKKGSAGGHNGIKSIISHLGTNVFPRIKVGVGEKPSGYDLADYVLGHFSKDDRAKMQEGYIRAMHAAEMLVAGDVEQAMNEYNKKAKQEA